MKKSRIRNSYLNNAIVDLSHGDTVVICDTRFAIADKARRIDLAIGQDVPGIAQTFELLLALRPSMH